VAILKDDLSFVVFLQKEDKSTVKIWSSEAPSNGQNFGTVTINEEGQVVVTDTTDNKIMYTSPSNGHPAGNYKLQITELGTLISINEQNQVQWESTIPEFKDVVQAAAPSSLTPGFDLKQGYFMKSDNKKCMAYLSPEGTLDILEGTTLKWSNDYTRPTERQVNMAIKMSKDGIISVYSASGVAVWSGEKTSGEYAYDHILKLLDTCQIQVASSKGEVVYSPAAMKLNQFTSASENLLTNKEL